MYLGKSPQHASTVALVLNLTTWHVSPKFHVTFNTMFKTVRWRNDPKDAMWKITCGFVQRTPVHNITRSHTQNEYSQAHGQHMKSKQPSQTSDTPTATQEGEAQDLNIPSGWLSTHTHNPIQRLTYVHMTEIMESTEDMESLNNVYCTQVEPKREPSAE